MFKARHDVKRGIPLYMCQFTCSLQRFFPPLIPPHLNPRAVTFPDLISPWIPSGLQPQASWRRAGSSTWGRTCRARALSSLRVPCSMRGLQPWFLRTATARSTTTGATICTVNWFFARRSITLEGCMALGGSGWPVWAALWGFVTLRSQILNRKLVSAFGSVTLCGRG